MGACRVEAGRAGVDDLDEAVPPGPEAGQVRWGGRKEEQVVAGSRQRDAIRIALAEGRAHPVGRFLRPGARR
jgi:hypothetical protein